MALPIRSIVALPLVAPLFAGRRRKQEQLALVKVRMLQNCNGRVMPLYVRQDSQVLDLGERLAMSLVC